MCLPIKRCQRHEFDPWVRKIPWRRKWQPTPVFLPGESHRQRSLAGYSPGGHKEADTAEWWSTTETSYYQRGGLKWVKCRLSHLCRPEVQNHSISGALLPLKSLEEISSSPLTASGGSACSLACICISPVCLRILRVFSLLLSLIKDTCGWV